MIAEVSNIVNLYYELGKKIYVFSTENAKTDSSIIKKYFPLNSKNFQFIKAKGKDNLTRLEKNMDAKYIV